MTAVGFSMNEITREIIFEVKWVLNDTVVSDKNFDQADWHQKPNLLSSCGGLCLIKAQFLDIFVGLRPGKSQEMLASSEKAWLCD